MAVKTFFSALIKLITFALLHCALTVILFIVWYRYAGRGDHTIELVFCLGNSTFYFFGKIKTISTCIRAKNLQYKTTVDISYPIKYWSMYEAYLNKRDIFSALLRFDKIKSKSIVGVRVNKAHNRYKQSRHMLMTVEIFYIVIWQIRTNIIKYICRSSKSIELSIERSCILLLCFHFNIPISDPAAFIEQQFFCQ